ncbi:hypothetical protein K443DRAFT_112353, partial [Laccaria amethystina LaAM-08-1]
GPPTLAFDASNTSLSPPNKGSRRHLKDYSECRGVWKCKGRPMRYIRRCDHDWDRGRIFIHHLPTIATTNDALVPCTARCGICTRPTNYPGQHLPPDTEIT